MYHRFLVRWRHFRVSGARWVRGSWSYLVLLFVIVLPLLWMAVVLAVRSGMFDLSGTAPGADTTGVFATFIAGGLATAGTLFAALLTYTHNKRAGLHLQLDTVIKSLDSLAAGKKPRVAGAIATMVVLGHQAVAMRVLDPAWEEGEVDPATATWLIDQVLQNEHRDDVAAREAAAILAKHAAHLVDPALHGMIYFPDHYTSGWNGKAVPPKEARLSLLKAMTKALTSQPKSWWLSTGQPMLWPGRVFLRCAAEDVDPSVRTSAAVLLDAVCHCFPKLREQLGEKPVAKALARAEQAALRHGATSRGCPHGPCPPSGCGSWPRRPRRGATATQNRSGSSRTAAHAGGQKPSHTHGKVRMS